MGVWKQQVKLIGEDTEELDRFGTSVAINGTEAFVGQMFDDDRALNSGAVYSFTRVDGNWIQKKKVIPGAGKKIVVEKVAPRSFNIIGNSTQQWSD